jgi:sterol 24-C-methyltransferase
LDESLQRHESYLVLRMGLKPGDKVLDIGCGVGGPLRRIAHLSQAHITGLTISPYQIQRAKTIGKCEYICTLWSELKNDFILCF